MATAAEILAAFAADLKPDDIPQDVRERAKDCLIDTVAACIFGAQLPWSRIVMEYAGRHGGIGRSEIIGTATKVSPPFAALANGTVSHSFELDSSSQPSVGVHPGTSLAAPGLAVGQDIGATGADLLTAMVAGFEVMYRIGDASRHSPEKIGFHAPGLTGTFGGAIVAGKLLRLDAAHLTNALGIAGSLCSGLLEFSQTGGMVKRLHLGRAAEGGVLAASLASDGFSGPASVLDGRYGYLATFCRDGDPARLTAGLSDVWHTRKTNIKRFAAHNTAHVAMALTLQLRQAHGFNGGDVDEIVVAGQEKLVSHHSIAEPQDLTTAQYSTPFCVALSVQADPTDPRSFSDANLVDPAIRDLCRRVRVEVRPRQPNDTALATSVTIRLRDGRSLTAEAQDYRGMPSDPLDRDGLAAKFFTLTASRPRTDAQRLWSELIDIERRPSLVGLQ